MARTRHLSIDLPVVCESSKSQPIAKIEHAASSPECLSNIVTRVWLMECFDQQRVRLFSADLFDAVARYCRVASGFDFIPNPERVLSLCKLALVADRYEEMTEFMMEFVMLKSRQFDEEKGGSVLVEDERAFWQRAMKQVISPKRLSLISLQDKDQDGYRHLIQKELRELLLMAIDVLDSNVAQKLQRCAPDKVDQMELVFVLSTKADYYRYLAKEFKHVDFYRQQARSNYERALEAAQKHSYAASPTVLGITLNYSVYLHDFGEKEEACRLTQTALDSFGNTCTYGMDGHGRQSTLLAQLLRQNLTFWTESV